MEIIDERLIRDIDIFLNIIIAVQSGRMAVNLLGLIDWKESSVPKSMFYLFASLAVLTGWSIAVVLLGIFDLRLLVWHLLNSAAVAVAMGSLFNILRSD